MDLFDFFFLIEMFMISVLAAVWQQWETLFYLPKKSVSIFKCPQQKYLLLELFDYLLEPFNFLLLEKSGYFNLTKDAETFLNSV